MLLLQIPTDPIGKRENMILRFPELAGGAVQGLNDAGVENFQGSIDAFLSRECGQNTGDARRDDVARVTLRFTHLEVPSASIPAFDELRHTLAACLERWGAKEKEREFFEHALATANLSSIPVLKISDYGTTGLSGSDTDESGKWFALVKSQGVSNKGNTAGGSFGIGKSSPFAASRLRTVFYGTRLVTNEVALQGVCRLVTHTNRLGRSTQGVGFIGNYDAPASDSADPVYRAVRSSKDIPDLFRREEPGTDIWVIGYKSGPEWSAELTKSLLANFWPAIHRGSIDFLVGEQVVTRDNLADLIGQHSADPSFDAHKYYRAIESQPIRRTLRHVGTCELYLTTMGDDLPKKICMTRNSGMRIYDYQPRASRVPFIGMFICVDESGNRLLRKMEPPKHDAWDPKRVESDEGRLALDEIKTWIREEIKKLNPHHGGASFNELELATYLQDLEFDETGAAGFLAGDVQSQDEALGTTPSPKEVLAVPIHAKATGRDSVEAEPGGAAAPVGPEGDLHGEDGASKRMGGSRNFGGGSGDTTRDSSVRARSFRRGGTSYEVVLRSAEGFFGQIVIRAIGEDGVTHPVEIESAALLGDGAGPLAVEKCVIENVRLEAGVATRLEVKLSESFRRALVVEARG